MKIIKPFIPYIIIALLVGLCVFLYRNQRILEKEVIRKEQNYSALKDTIENYKDEKERSVGEKKALRLKISELADSIKIEKSKPPVFITDYKTNLVEKIVTETQVKRDTVIVEKGDTFKSSLFLEDYKSWGNSQRDISVKIPYTVQGDTLIYSDSSRIDLKQNIWLNTNMYRDSKSGQVYLKLMTDYPGVTFNEANSILIEREDDEWLDLNRNARKRFGVGVQVGVGYFPVQNTVGPYIGVGIHFSPKKLQW